MKPTQEQGIKVWWVLAWETYYPNPSLGNVDSCWETEEEARARADELLANNADENCIDYVDHVWVKNISEMLGL